MRGTRIIFEITPDGGKGYKWWFSTKERPVAVSSFTFQTEQECRSDIAKAKKAYAGAKFAKVKLGALAPLTGDD